MYGRPRLNGSVSNSGNGKTLSHISITSQKYLTVKFMKSAVEKFMESKDPHHFHQYGTYYHALNHTVHAVSISKES